jgi:DNA-binding CsgD family transcriptional regulator
MLLGRRQEIETLDRVLADVRAGRSRALVLRGPAGIGKTALLERLAAAATGCRILRAAGVESEMELAFAGLHALCAPMLDRLDRLPGPQANALRTAFGLSPGPPPDRFMVGLAVLSLLADAAEAEPLLCLVDDAQWLDLVSAQTLAFVARRLLAERVGLVFGLRATGDDEDVRGVPELELAGLDAAEARALLDATLRGPLDPRVQDRILAEANGNPLALLELPHGHGDGGFALPDALPLSGRLEQGFARRLEPLPAATRRLLLLAAAEPLGDVTLLWRAAERLGVGAGAAEPAESAGLIEIGAHVRFRHPLVRSAAYRAATAPDRRDVHAALAAATDAQHDPDRRAWHRAHAAERQDEAVAAELERSAGRAQARGGLAAAATFLERAAALTPDPADRGARALAAAQALLLAGAFDRALELLRAAEASPLDELASARIDLLRARIAFTQRHGNDAPGLLLAAARRLEPLDAALARDTYLEALTAALFAARLASGTGTAEVAQAAAGLPAPARGARDGDVLLHGLTVMFTAGYAEAAPIVQCALRAFREDTGEERRWLWIATMMARALWDFDTWFELSSRHVALARAAGALGELPLALTGSAQAYVFTGELDTAASLLEELRTVNQATGARLNPAVALGLTAWRGHEREARELIAGALAAVTVRGEGVGIAIARWAEAVLANGLGRYDDALAAAQESVRDPHEHGSPQWAISELVEAAAKLGATDVAQEALSWLAAMTQPAGTDWGLGLEARCRALLSDGAEAERLYREAIARIARTRLRGELGRARLLYGEWLREVGRRDEARAQLRAAYDTLAGIGADAFAERARAELQATGESVPRRPSGTRDALTPQEAQIARLAADGHTNPEIGAQLFISPRTVEYHLRKVYDKLDVGSRRDLAGALP